MIGCEEIRSQLVFYLDRELSGEESRILETHVADCAACRAELEHERGFLERVRDAAPLYPAPEGLRRRLASMPSAPANPVVSVAIPRLRQTRRVIAWAAGALFAIGGLWLGLRADWTALRGGPSDFVLAAVDTHQRYLHGTLPLEFAGEDPARASAWFAGKLAFPLRLSGQSGPAYRLQGGRLVGYKGDYVAYVSYRAGAASIGLLVASAAEARPSGGETIASGRLVFHHDHVAGFKVITWTDQGLSYALITSLSGKGENACGICHAGNHPLPAGRGSERLRRLE
jgi:anti-sigma factor RsiW